MSRKRISRRRFIAGTAATAAAISAPHVSTSYAAGKLSLGMWDHWVPGGNKIMDEIAQEWAQKEKVDLTIDYLSTQGNKLLLTIAAEAQAKAGHDVMDFSAWEPAQYTRLLEPVGDVMKRDLITVAPETTTHAAILLMKERGIGSLPVVKDGRLIGIVTERDFMDIASELLEEKLKE